VLFAESAKTVSARIEVYWKARRRAKR
jgi:hypothetical protein